MSVEISPRNNTVDTSERTEQERITAAVAKIVENRTIIDQAKGMLMFDYSIDAEAAFELLRWQSQYHNVKIRHLAEQIAKDLAELHQTNPLAQQLTYDRLILTAHARIASQPRH